LHRLAALLRKDLSAERAHLIIEQTELRQRAKEKFGRASEMFFTRKGYEQATDEGIAKYKAMRAAALARPPADLCCGIGGDLLALGALAAQRGEQALGVDLDSITAHLAAVNCERLLGCSAAKIEVRDANKMSFDSYGLIHLDPDRRADGARHTRFDDLAPGGDLLERYAGRSIAMKLAPATEVPESWSNICEREWIGSGRECKQQVLWLGGAARTVGRRCATVVDERGIGSMVIEDPHARLEMSEAVERYIYEPHAAVLAAGLAASLASLRGGLSALTADGGYLTGPEAVTSPTNAVFEVEAVLPFDMKQLKAALREREIGQLEIKKRGVSDDPSQLRKRLELRGENAATLIIARGQTRAFAAIVKRVG
jgi:hypothetical protein